MTMSTPTLNWGRGVQMCVKLQLLLNYDLTPCMCHLKCKCCCGNALKTLLKSRCYLKIICSWNTAALSVQRPPINCVCLASFRRRTDALSMWRPSSILACESLPIIMCSSLAATSTYSDVTKKGILIVTSGLDSKRPYSARHDAATKPWRNRDETNRVLSTKRRNRSIL